MKIRNGFVSNSSSSSFVVSQDAYESVVSIAKQMVRNRFWDQQDKELLKKLSKIKDIDKNKPIAFRTCNYETYISKEDDKYYIFTSSNHLFSEIIEGRSNEYSLAEIEEMEEGIKSKNLYYWPEYDKYGTPLTYQETKDHQVDFFCPDCIIDVMYSTEGHIFCVKCSKIIKEKKNEN